MTDTPETAKPLPRETFYSRSMSLPDELMVGTTDIHVHSGPWLKSCPGRLTPFQIAEQAKAAGMKALVLYDHTLGVSNGTSQLVNWQVPGIEIFGGIILTSNFGGLNPRAVKTALYYGAGARFVHFGAHCTHYMASHEGSFIDGKGCFSRTSTRSSPRMSYRARSASPWRGRSRMSLPKSCS